MTSGADIAIQCLVNHGVDTVFAYPGGASMPLHQALTRFRDKIRVILPRHEQGGGFAAQGYARSTGKVGVCMATSGPGATNLVTTHRRRQARQHPDGGHHRPGRHAGDRHRRLSGDADRRGLPQRHQAPLPGHRRERPRPRDPRGVPHGHHGPAGPGADRLAQERPVGPDRARLRRADGSARLSRRRPAGPRPEQIAAGGRGDPAVASGR